jgi:hypothetical protein
VVHRILLLCDSRDLAVRHAASWIDQQEDSTTLGIQDRSMYVAQRPWRPGRRAVHQGSLQLYGCTALVQETLACMDAWPLAICR